MNNKIYISHRLMTALSSFENYGITIVEAPTGYGKSVSVRALCEQTEREFSWLNIYTTDNFEAWNNLCNTIFDEDVAEQMIEWPFPVVGKMRKVFLEEVKRILGDRKMLVVLDDYHLIQSEQSNAFLTYMANEMGDQLKYVVISQKQVFADQPLLVSTGKIGLVSVEDLKLPEEEYETYLHACGIDEIDDELLQIYEKSEGWISMIAVSVQNYIRTGKAATTIDMEHLVDRVAYASCSSKAKDLLIHFTQMQDFTKEVADYVCGYDTQKVLDELLQNHFFFYYDKERETYHIHTILLKCIQNHFDKLSLVEKCTIYEKNAAYQYDIKNYLRAMYWMEKAGNYSGMLQCLELCETICSAKERREIFYRCFDVCPPSLFDDYPMSLLLFMWRFYNYGDWERVEHCLEMFRHIMDVVIMPKEKHDYLQKCYYLFMAQYSYNDLEKMFEYLEKGLSLEGDVFPNIDQNIPRNYGVPSILHQFMRDSSGEEMVDYLSKHLDTYIKLGVGKAECIKYFALAEFCFFKGDYDFAVNYCHKCIRSCKLEWEISIQVSCCYLLAQIEMIRGNKQEGIDNVNKARELILTHCGENSPLTYTGEMCESMFHDYSGYPENVSSWTELGGEIPENVLPPARPYAALMQYGRGLRMEKYSEIIESKDDLMEMLSMFPNSFTEANFDLVLASAYSKSGKQEEALAYVRQAIDVIGTQFPTLFCMFSAYLTEPYAMIDRERDDFGEIMEFSRKFTIAAKTVSQQNNNLIFPMLTKRENEVALLVLDGLTNKEIANALFVSENTVKSSLKSIFSKVGITSRRELLRVAQMGGLI